MIPILVVICFRWFRFMAGRLYRTVILLQAIFLNNIMCATAEFSQAVETIFCKVFVLIFFRNASLLSSRITLSANCCELRLSLIDISEPTRLGMRSYDVFWLK